MENLFNFICYFNVGWYVKDFFDELAVNSPEHRMSWGLFNVFLKETFKQDDPNRKIDVWVEENNGRKGHIIVKGNCITYLRG